MRNYLKFGPIVLEKMSFKDFFLFLALMASLFNGVEPPVQFKNMHYGDLLLCQKLL